MAGHVAAFGGSNPAPLKSFRSKLSAKERTHKISQSRWRSKTDALPGARVARHGVVFEFVSDIIGRHRPQAPTTTGIRAGASWDKHATGQPPGLKDAEC